MELERREAGRHWPGHVPEPFPRSVDSIHQIEIASSCNLSCKYCPSRNLDKPYAEGGFEREKQLMDRRTFERSLEWVSHFNAKGQQGELALTGLGEALMHPEFADFVRLAREALPGEPITFSTNGILLTDKLCEQIAPYNPRIYISLHRPEKAKKAVDIARRWGLLDNVNIAYATEAFNWAGALDWDVTIAEGSTVCEFLRTGWGMILADGRFSACCLDASGASSRGTVWDEIGSATTAPWIDEANGAGCAKCHETVAGWDGETYYAEPRRTLDILGIDKLPTFERKADLG